MSESGVEDLMKSKRVRTRVSLTGIALLVGCALAAWPGMITKVASSNYLPHGFCYLWNPQLLTLHLVSDLLIWLSYMVISGTLAFVVYRYRRDIPLSGIVVAFGVFIVACGFTHFMEIVVLWKPLYWLAGDIKLVTAVASVLTAVALPMLLPQIGEAIGYVVDSTRNKRQFLAIANGSMEAFYILESVRDPAGEIVDFRFTFANGNGGRLVFSTPEKLVGLLLLEEFPFHRTNGLFERFRTVANTGELIDEDLFIDEEKVDAHWLRLRVSKLDDGIAITNSNLTESWEMAARYRALLEAAPDAMVVVDEAGDIVLLNLRAQTQFGFAREELVGRSVKTIIPGGVHPDPRTADELLPDSDAIGRDGDSLALHRDGSTFPIEMMLSPLKTARGTLVMAAIRNIAARREGEAHLARLESRHRALLEAAPDAMVLVNQQGGVVLVNNQAEKQFGFERAELVGQQVNKIIPESAGEQLIAEVLDCAAKSGVQKQCKRVELDGRHRNGSVFPMEVMLSALDSSEGVLVAAAIRDITVRKQEERVLLRKNEELKRSNRDLEQFAYVASHDLQEPLRMVASYTQLLSRRYKGKLDADADEFIAYAVDGASRMQRLIQDLLAYSRIGTAPSELAQVCTEDTLEHAMFNLRGAIADSGAVVTHGPMPYVMADESQLVQLLQNLVGNGIKYRKKNQEPPEVNITATRNGGERWKFAVKDNGVGIEPRYHERIFGMFQRLHKREEYSGTGIGLAICRKIVERHGGQISVESTLGEGSTFLFSLAGIEECA